MNLNEQVKEALEKIGFQPIFKNANIFNYKNLTIDISDISTMEGLLIEAFQSGAKSKIRDIKTVLEIVDPRF